MLRAPSPGLSPAASPGPATSGSIGPVGGRGPTGTCAVRCPEPALAKAGGWRLDRAAQGAGSPRCATHRHVAAAVAARQGGRNSGSSSCLPWLSAPAHRRAQGDGHEFTPARMPDQGGRQEQPGIGHQLVIVEADLYPIGMVG